MTAVVAVSGADGANRTNYFLYAERPAGAQGIIPVKLDSNQIQYPMTRDCRAIDFGT